MTSPGLKDCFDQECRKLSNYHTLMAIISGLNVSAVGRLKETWEVRCRPLSPLVFQEKSSKGLPPTTGSRPETPQNPRRPRNPPLPATQLPLLSPPPLPNLSPVPHNPHPRPPPQRPPFPRRRQQNHPRKRSRQLLQIPHNVH